MAQGMNKKLKKAPNKKNSARGAKQQKKVAKGKRSYQMNKNKKKYQREQHHQNMTVETSKAINKKNEALIACKAISSGSKFFMKDITDSGSKEHQQQLKQRNKKEEKSKKLTDRLQDQLRKLDK